MYPNIVRAVEAWKAQGVVLPRADDLLSLQGSFLAAGVEPTEDFLFLYTLCGGMPNEGGDSNWFELWSPERCIQELPESVFLKQRSGFLAFATGFLDAHAYCLRPNDKHTSAVFVAYEPRYQPELVASSLDQALGYLLSEPKRLHLP